MLAKDQKLSFLYMQKASDRHIQPLLTEKKDGFFHFNKIHKKNN